MERVSTQLQRLLDPNSIHRPRRSDLMMFYFQRFVRSETWVTERSGDMGYIFRPEGGGEEMPWKERSVTHVSGTDI